MRRPGRRGSLVLRLLVLSVLISVCSIGATAWLAVRTTARAIHQEQGQVFADDARIYDTLLGLAARQDDWRGAQQLVDRLARETGHRIALTDQDRRPFADSAAPAPSAGASGSRSVPLPERASATVDPLAVDSVFVPGAGDSDRIDPRAVGPFRLPPGERDHLRELAQREAACLHDLLGIDSTVTTAPSGRPRLQTYLVQPPTGSRCEAAALDEPTATEARALARLNTLADTCLARRDAPPLQLALDLTWTTTGSRSPAARRTQAQCLATARREQLTPYVAPPALLFVGAPDPEAAVPSSPFDLSAPNRVRIAGVVGGVLLLTVAVTVVLGLRLVRPLRALTGAARRFKDGDVSVRVAVTGRDEISRLAEVFNEMSRRRAELERLRTAMVGDVAHELRTPLSTIRGWLEAAEDGIVPADGPLISSLLEEALLLQHVVDDLQDLAAADAGELRLHKGPVDLADLLRQVATAHRGRADKAGVVLAVDAADGLGDLHADPVRLRQAVGNLVSNAVRHTPPGGSVTLRGRRDGDTVLVAVADTGTGIGPEDLPHVFDRFWRAEKSRSRSTGGSGLGLAIVRNLAHAHGGTVTAGSTLGAGSVFTLRLPVSGGTSGADADGEARRGTPR
ncbi:ATP-binding protein [Streptomyces sp. NPDC046977]|uniref:sensor histidine kinase n=1 Tax=Streptomyces sp. NPDC046977 TaxID=3154703 RepID=UPI0034090614